MDTIECMRAFAAVANQSSFTAAASQLGMSTKLASKYVRQLEERLGVQLLHRTTRSVNLTETGRAYLERCAPLLEELDELEGFVHTRHSELAGGIRITAPTTFGSRQLIDVLVPFQQQHPKVSVDLVLSDSYQPLIEGGFDLAVRFGALDDSSLLARKLMDMRVAVFASPAYLKKHGRPKHPSELRNMNCILRSTSNEQHRWSFKIDGRRTSYSVKGSTQANSPRAVTHLARAGLGIGRSPIYAALPFIRSGELELLFEKQESTSIPLQVVYPPSRYLSARVRALIDHLGGALKAENFG